MNIISQIAYVNTHTQHEHMYFFNIFNSASHICEYITFPYGGWGCYGSTGDRVKGIVHFEIKIWYLSAYPKGIQDVGVFFSSVDPILMFLGQTVLVCQSYNGRYRSLSL